ncbi:zinc finger, C2H2 type [Ostertagia ostertagi]
MADNCMQHVKAEDEPQVLIVDIPKAARKRKPPRTQARILLCRFCGHWMQQSTLLVHLPAVHGTEGSKEAERMLLAKKNKVRCDVEGCDYTTHSERDYRVHMRETHLMIIEKQNRRLKCLSCEKLLNSQEELVYHCRTVHGDEDCTIQTCTFRSKEECEMWKDFIARTHCTAWQISGKSHRSQVNNDHIVYYRCSRVPSKQHRTRSEGNKTQTTSTVHYCTSFLKEIHSHNGLITVRYCLKHVNHDFSHARLPLSNADKAVIAQYSQQTHDAEVIQNMIRQAYTDPETKLHWVSTSEIKRVLTSLVRSVREEARDSMNVDFDDGPVFASALLQSPPDKDDDSDCCIISDDAVSVQSPDPGIQAESLLGCSSCAKLSERVAELEAIVKRLNSRVIELEDAQLFSGVVKTETDSSQADDTGMKQEQS